MLERERTRTPSRQKSAMAEFQEHTSVLGITWIQWDMHWSCQADLTALEMKSCTP